MNASDATTSDRRKASADGRPEPDFVQLLKDKSIAARLITPPGLKALLIAVVVALLNGLVIFASAQDSPSTAATDLATSFAFTMLFSLVLGTWLSVIFEEVLIKIMTHASGNLESRTNRLVERVNELRDEPILADHPQDDRTTDYRASIIELLYRLSFPFIGTWLIFRILQGYVYTDSSAIPHVRTATDIYTALLYLSLTAGALLICWTGGRIVWVWYRIRTLERQIDTVNLEPDIHALIPVDTSIADRITSAHRQTVRFVTGVF